MSGNMKKKGTFQRPGISHKRFILCLTVLMLLFVAVNYIIWKSATEALLTKKYDGGDLARMGYLPGSKDYRKTVDDLPLRHLEMNEFKGQPVDVLTIGDSFSIGGGEGRNSYYQDYLASSNNFSVVNVFPYPTGDLIAQFSPVSTLAVLYNSGYLDRIKPRYVLLESVVRYCIPRFSPQLNFTKNDSLSAIENFYANKTIPRNYLPKVGFINEGNFKYLYFNLMYRFSDNGFRRLVYRKQLDRPFFSVKDDRALILHGEDIQSARMLNRQSVKALNDNLNRLSDILAAKGIKLCFMPIVDKYDLYSDYIIDKRYARNIFFDELRPLPRRYTFIDTKEILLDLVRKGEKDIFYADDSHWSWKAAKAVFEKTRFDAGNPVQAK